MTLSNKQPYIFPDKIDDKPTQSSSRNVRPFLVLNKSIVVYFVIRDMKISISVKSKNILNLGIDFPL